MKDHSRVTKSISDYERVLFYLTQDEQGYPPVTVEGILATRVGKVVYRLENIPFFATGVNFGDLVVAREKESGQCIFESVAEFSGHSTIRLLVWNRDKVQSVRNLFREMGCDSELSHLPRLIAIDVPPEANLNLVRHRIQMGAEEGKWDFEDGSIRVDIHHDDPGKPLREN